MTLDIYSGTLDGVRDTADAASYSTLLTVTVTPLANSLVVCPIWTWQAGGATPPHVTAPSGWGLTWESIYGPDDYDSVGTTTSLQVYAALVGSSPTAGNISYTLDGTSTSGSCIVDNFQNVDTSGGTAASCFVQTSSVAQGTATSGSQTLSALASSRNVAYGANMRNGVNEVGNAGGAFTLLADYHTTSPLKGYDTEWAANQTTVDFSWSTSTDYGIWAAEIKASPVRYGVWFV